MLRAFAAGDFGARLREIWVEDVGESHARSLRRARGDCPVAAAPPEFVGEGHAERMGESGVAHFAVVRE